MRIFKMLAAVVIGSAVIGSVAWFAKDYQTPAPRAPAAPPSRAVEGANLVVALKQAARNPDSFKVESVLQRPNGAVCVEYRAQNGFGGMNVGHAFEARGKVHSGDDNAFRAAWNANCGGTGFLITDQVEALIARAEARR